MRLSCMWLVHRTQRTLIIALTAAGGLLFSAATHAAPSAGPQALFDQASQAADRNDCAAALPMFERLAADPRIRAGTTAAGAIAVRRGLCLVKMGRSDEGARHIEAGLPILRKAGAELTGDVFEGESALATVATRRWDHDGTIAHLKAALAIIPADAQGRIAILVRLAQATAFDGGDTPLSYLREAERITQARDKPDKVTLATIHTTRGRILMNQGRNKEALAELKEALDLSGGLTMRASLDQIAIRGDLAQASLLNGKEEDARLYLAYTGAGRIEESPFSTATAMELPTCGATTGLSPDDSAIVEFSIDENGDVASAQTVYTRGNHAVAAAFAQQVYGWYWEAAQIAKIPAFFKTLVRIELRCSNTGTADNDILSPLRERFFAWASPLLQEFGPKPDKRGDLLELLAARATQAENEGKLPVAVAAIVASILNTGRPSEIGVMNDFEHAQLLAKQAHLPIEVSNTIRVYTVVKANQLSRRLRRQAEARGLVPEGDAAAAFAALPELADDPLAQATLLLLSKAKMARNDAAVATLTRVADDQRLGARHPLRQVALLQLANIAAARKQLDAAQAYFRRTGLTEQQCALLGIKPALKSSGIFGSEGFPDAALRYGFEGWVNLEYDISARGRTEGVRAVVAYPPFVFAEAAEKVAKGMSYRSTYRPEGGAACSANRQTIGFIIPR